MTPLANPAAMVKMIEKGAPRVIHTEEELDQYAKALFRLTAKDNPTASELPGHRTPHHAGRAVRRPHPPHPVRHAYRDPALSHAPAQSQAKRPRPRTRLRIERLPDPQRHPQPHPAPHPRPRRPLQHPRLRIHRIGAHEPPALSLSARPHSSIPLSLSFPEGESAFAGAPYPILRHGCSITLQRHRISIDRLYADEQLAFYLRARLQPCHNAAFALRLQPLRYA